MEKDLKAEAIRKAWIEEIGEERFEQIKSKINKSDGKINYKDLPEFKYSEAWQENYPFGFESYEWFNNRGDNYEMVTEYNVWPKSLHGIEDNNGWTRIEADGSNLPKGTVFDYFDVCLFENGKFNHSERYESGLVSRAFKSQYITHFKPIEKHKPPIY